MNANPLPVAEFLAAPTAPAPGIDGQLAVDPRLAAGPTVSLRGAADFAALLLQSADLNEARLEQPEVAVTEPVSEAPSAPSCPAPAIETLLFMAALQMPAVAAAAAATQPATSAVLPAGQPSTIDMLSSIHRQVGDPGVPLAEDASGNGLVDPSRLPLLVAPEGGAWRPKLPPVQLPASAVAEQRRGAEWIDVEAPPVPSFEAPGTGEDVATRVPESLFVEAKALMTASGGASTPAATAPVAVLEAPSLSSRPPVESPVQVRVALETPVHDPMWRVDAANRIASLVTRGVEHAELRVTPPELGPVELRIDLRGADATLAIVATQATTRDALEQALPLLRDLLAQQGLSLGQATVRDGRQGDQSSRGEGTPGRTATFGETEALPPVETRPAHLRRLIDVFA